MRNLFFFLVISSSLISCKYNRVEVINTDVHEPEVEEAARWSSFVFLVSVPQFDYGMNEETLDVYPGLRLDDTHILTKGVYLHGPREDKLVAKIMDGQTVVALTLQEQHFGGGFSLLKAADSLPGVLPTFSKRHPYLGEDVTVGPYRARIFEAHLYGERFRRYQVVFRRHDGERPDFPDQCAPGLPVLDAKNNVLGVMREFVESSGVFAPIGFGNSACKIITTVELFKTFTVGNIHL